ncbi:MAG: hypothetical protein P8103_02675 [Candidatus Thiodiazotropha sp.]
MRDLSLAERGLPVACVKEAVFALNTKTLGFRLDTTKELSLNLKDWSNEPIEIDNIVTYGWALGAFIRAVTNNAHLHKNDRTRTVFVDVGDEIGFTDFDLDQRSRRFWCGPGAGAW